MTLMFVPTIRKHYCRVATHINELVMINSSTPIKTTKTQKKETMFISTASIINPSEPTVSGPQPEKYGR